MQMKAKRCAVVLAGLAVLIPALWVVARAADKAGGNVPEVTFAAQDRDTLRGLQGVRVLVKALEPEAERSGLTRQALQTDAELQLRQYGIDVLTEEACLKTPGTPWLYINVHVAGVSDLSLVSAVNIEVRFEQQVCLVRDPAVRCVGATWHQSYTGRGPRRMLPEVRDRVKDLMALFINDYLAVNPKERKT
jgi:hypothetical protein